MHQVLQLFTVLNLYPFFFFFNVHSNLFRQILFLRLKLGKQTQSIQIIYPKAKTIALRVQDSDPVLLGFKAQALHHCAREDLQACNSCFQVLQRLIFRRNGFHLSHSRGYKAQNSGANLHRGRFQLNLKNLITVGYPSAEQTAPGRNDMKGSQPTIKSSVEYCVLELRKKDFLRLGKIFGPEVSCLLALRFHDSPELFSSTFSVEVPSMTPSHVITKP